MSRALRLRSSHLSPLEMLMLVGALIAAVIILAPVMRGLSASTASTTTPMPEITQPSADAIVGLADVRDGDTLRIGGERIRLEAADAFELHQTCSTGPCGLAARGALQAMTFGREVVCEPVDTDRYGRTIANCSVDGRDIGAELVRQGHALAYRRYSMAYVDEEAAARSARAGAWAGSFQNPEDWRRDHPRA